jgi:hypothetical protein
LMWHMHGRGLDFAIDLVFSSFSLVHLHGYCEYSCYVGPNLLHSAGSESKQLLWQRSEHMSMAMIFIWHHVHCSAKVFGFIICISVMCSDEYDFLLLLHLKLRE